MVRNNGEKLRLTQENHIKFLQVLFILINLMLGIAGVIAWGYSLLVIIFIPVVPIGTSLVLGTGIWLLVGYYRAFFNNKTSINKPRLWLISLIFNLGMGVIFTSLSFDNHILPDSPLGHTALVATACWCYMTAILSAMMLIKQPR